MSLLSPALAFAGAAMAATGIGLLSAPLLDARSARPGAAGGAGQRALGLLGRLGLRMRPGGTRAPHELHARIAAAGSPGDMGLREVMAAKLAAATGAALLGTALAQIAPGRLGLAFALGAPVAGFLGPDLWLRQRAAVRAQAARRELAGALDTLLVTVEAGAALPDALSAVGSRSAGPLAQEWRTVGREVALGVPLATALAGMAERLPLDEVRALAGALDRAQRHGAPLAETLAAQAHDARAALRRHVREEGARAGPKMQLVVALLLVPSVLLLVAAALVAALLDSGGGMTVL